MAAKITNPGTQTFDAPREHRSYRLAPQLIAVIEDLAMGIEAGDAGLKSCTMGAVSAAANGASAAVVNATHHREVTAIDDVDECLDAIGDLLALGCTFAEVADRITLSGGATHMLALERWCDRVRMRCKAPSDFSTLASLPWRSARLHEDRRRGERAMRLMNPADTAVLHIAYGPRDPFVDTMPAEVRVEIGKELAPLARYTDAIERHRQDMVRAAVAAHETVVDLARHRSIRNWTERNLTSGDALRDAVSAFAEPMPVQSDSETKPHFDLRKDERKTRRLAHEAKIGVFLTAVKRDADVMLRDASLAFRDAWDTSQ